ncbi:unnamed protein product [Lota lota]
MIMVLLYRLFDTAAVSTLLIQHMVGSSMSHVLAARLKGGEVFLDYQKREEEEEETPVGNQGIGAGEIKRILIGGYSAKCSAALTSGSVAPSHPVSVPLADEEKGNKWGFYLIKKAQKKKKKKKKKEKEKEKKKE